MLSSFTRGSRTKESDAKSKGSSEHDEIDDVEGPAHESEPLRDLVAERDDEPDREDASRRVAENDAEREAVGKVRCRAAEPRRQRDVQGDDLPSKADGVSDPAFAEPRDAGRLCGPREIHERAEREGRRGDGEASATRHLRRQYDRRSHVRTRYFPTRSGRSVNLGPCEASSRSWSSR
jgi:hypothetical protein